MQIHNRPKYLNLFVLARSMSITAKISILHRITGFLLFLSIPLILYLLHRSLINPDSYAAFYAFTSQPLLKLAYLALIFGFIYHLCSGVRFLLLDFHQGVAIKTAKKTAWWVLVVSIIITGLLGVIIW
jgi:succinate dehydrogenase / fumarate reductase cytochrome b subunit